MKILTLLLLALAVLQAEEISGGSTRCLSENLAEPAFFPFYAADGQSVYFTGAAYTGLRRMDRSDGHVQIITDARGAGYEPRVLPDGSLVFRQDSYSRGRKYTSLQLVNDRGQHELLSARRFVSPAGMDAGQLVFLADNQLTTINLQTGKPAAPAANLLALINDNRSLILQQGPVEKPLTPLGEADYIWASLSPQKDRLVFTKVGQGTFVCDLQGEIMAAIADAHAPRWSADGRYLVFMRDEDDGERYTASEIWIATADGSRTWKITDTPDRIEMYPQWSPDGKYLVYHTPDGQLFETTLEIAD